MKKVVVTGGSGRLGQLVIGELLTCGYEVLSLDRIPPREKACTSWIADLCDAGHVYEALKESFGVIHLGAYQAPNLVPDSETFINNVAATYNVLKAAADLGVKKVVVASSTAAFGFIYAKIPWSPDYLPIDEHHPSKPQDPYGLSKVVAEQSADSILAVHKEMTVSSLRFPGIIFDFSYEIVRNRWNDPKGRASGFWAYIDARDAATACRLALEAGFSGHEVMIVAASRSSMKEPTDELTRQYFPSARKASSALTGNWSGVSSGKAERIIGFTAKHLWEHYLTI